MRDAPGSASEGRDQTVCPELGLLTVPSHHETAPAAFWPDVFVERGLPWRRFGQSGVYHVLALVLIWAGSRFLALQTHSATQTAFTHADVVYYAPSEYLPPLDTRRSTSTRARAADPEYSAQPIISVPPEADNRSQTIVTPPDIKLKNGIALPNVVVSVRKNAGQPADADRPSSCRSSLGNFPLSPRGWNAP